MTKTRGAKHVDLLKEGVRVEYLPVGRGTNSATGVIMEVLKESEKDRALEHMRPSVAARGPTPSLYIVQCDSTHRQSLVTRLDIIRIIENTIEHEESV